MTQYDIVFAVNEASSGELFSEQKIRLGKGQMLIGTQTFPMALPPILNESVLFGNDQEPTGVSVISKEELLGKIGLIPKTHAQLYALVSNEELIPGANYLISDYRTTYTQPVSNFAMQGDMEPLVVRAVSTSEFDPVAVSTLHPKDIIYYDINSSQSRVPGCTKGYIYRRIDTILNNDLPFDFRQVKFRRWKITSAGSYPNSGYASPQSTTFNGLSVDANDYNDYYFFNGLASTYYNNKIEANQSNLLAECNSVVDGGFQDNKVASAFKGNTISTDFKRNTIMGLFQFNIIRGQCADNVFHTTVNNNYIDSYFQSNIFLGYFTTNVIGVHFKSNMLHKSFMANTIGIYFRDNLIRGSFTNNEIDDQFKLNEVLSGLVYIDTNSDGTLHSDYPCTLVFDLADDEWLVSYYESRQLYIYAPNFTDLTPPS